MLQPDVQKHNMRVCGAFHWCTGKQLDSVNAQRARGKPMQVQRVHFQTPESCEHRKQVQTQPARHVAQSVTQKL